MVHSWLYSVEQRLALFIPPCIHSFTSAEYIEALDSNTVVEDECKSEPANQASESDAQYSQKTFCENGSFSCPLSDQNESDELFDEGDEQFDETAQAVKGKKVDLTQILIVQK